MISYLHTVPVDIYSTTETVDIGAQHSRYQHGYGGLVAPLLVL